ncbi:hypothetical protein RF11_14259 [Thelohanellus kitauei]|uniref:Uncharacterized protein n=1 Tax=Thelohanellus kitauei TaxID=669202 RepID=A0A0C2MEV0_THEKT|nr:hypothetical protein RF11_14259 [Thelohanellus kitauei]
MIKFDRNDKKEIKELESKVMELENELIRKNSELACLQDKRQITQDELAVPIHLILKNNQDFQEINAQIDELKNQLEFYERANFKLLDQLTITEEQFSRSEKDFNCTITDLKRTMELKERQMLFIYHGQFLNQSNIALQRALTSLKERSGNNRGQATTLDGPKARESRRILDLKNQLHDQEILYRNKHVTDFQNLQDLHHKEVLEITKALTSLRHRNTELEDEISHIKHLLHDVTTEVHIKNSILKSCFGVLDKNIAISNYDPEVLSRYLEKHPKSAKTAMDTFLDILDSKIYNLAYMRDK